MSVQMALPLDLPELPQVDKSVELLPFEEYQKIVVNVSAGKDSTAALLALLEMGVPPEKIELWHQRVDAGNEMFDWPSTEPYIDALAELLGVRVYYQWREGGLYGELKRVSRRTADVYYQADDKSVVCLPTTKGQESTRLRWPALSPDLRVRWCSAVAKVDVCRRVLSNHPRFQGTLVTPIKILVVTGERWEESAQRSRYLECELHPCNTKSRIVHWYRPVLKWTEAQVWHILRRWSLRPHPAYYLGFGRVSCMGCIFCTPDLWAIIRYIAPERFQRFVDTEKEINHTIDPKMTLTEKADRGSLDRLPNDSRLPEWIAMAMSHHLRAEDLIMQEWELPAGAFSGAAGGAL